MTNNSCEQLENGPLSNSIEEQVYLLNKLGFLNNNYGKISCKKSSKNVTYYSEERPKNYSVLYCTNK